VQATVTAQHGDVTDRWVLSTRKSLREQLASLASKFKIADIHNYDFYLVDTSCDAGGPLSAAERAAAVAKAQHQRANHRDQ
jgi:hypothetical protein